jgi:GntR family transcriptional regulator
MLRRAPSLTDQVKAHLKEMIVNGEFAGGRIPPEVELAGVLGVSRTTVRDALSRLEMEGTISRRQGAGTFVNDPVLQIHSRLEEIWDYAAMLKAHGFTPSVSILEAERTTARAPLLTTTAAELHLEPDAPILLLKKLFRENDEPVILTQNVVPLAQLVEPYTPDDLVLPIYEFLETFGRQRLAYYLTEIVPVLAEGETAALLGVEPGAPLVSFDETGYNEANEPILKAYSHFRDDLLRLRLLRRRV